jgi:5-deoxy-glucuronate isomerase
MREEGRAPARVDIMSVLHLEADSVARNGDRVHVPPERAGWTYTGLDVLRLQEGERRVIDTGERELLVLPLSGACMVQVDDRRFDLAGRPDVFAAVSDFVYAGAASRVELSSRTGGEFALPWARAVQTFPPAYCTANDVHIEVRGAGRATRHIHNLFTHDVAAAERLIVVEVLTPPGNWSSWPPHKHDDASSGDEDELEEIYYFRIAGANGFGLHRTYTLDGKLDETVTVRDGDVFLVPRGYHGPCIAAPEFAMYYLNVLAGPGTARTLRFSDDPAYAWIRESWKKGLGLGS